MKEVGGDGMVKGDDSTMEETKWLRLTLGASGENWWLAKLRCLGVAYGHSPEVSLINLVLM